MKFIFEAYDGIAVLTTLDARKGLVVLRIAPGCRTIADAVLKDLGRSILIESVISGPGENDL